ncbi:MAG: hypothetical protein CL677_04050, partial [Bdellovibrionaceae bacterium]|nr:hypothetical protein [Pseudobdellovibrionaceae bacterium]
DYPEESLAMVLAHEMGHAIDPCNSQFGMYQVDVKKFMQLDPSSTDDEVVQQILADDDLIFFMEHVDQNVTEENSQISDKVKMYLSDPGKLKYFEDLGIISLKTEPPPEVSQRGNHLYGYVLQDVYSCLQPKEGIRSVTKSDIEVAVNSYIQERLAIMGDTFDVESEKEKLTSAFTKYPQCFGPGSSGQMGEAMSDWWGAKVVGDMYSDREYKTDKERLRPYAFWIGQLCYQRANYEYLDTNEASVAEIAYQVIGNQYRNNMSHPKSIARLEKIFLSDPRMREAMGCEPTQEPLCSHSISGSGESRGDSRSQQSGGTR